MRCCLVLYLSLFRPLLSFEKRTFVSDFVCYLIRDGLRRPGISAVWPVNSDHWSSRPKPTTQHMYRDVHESPTWKPISASVKASKKKLIESHCWPSLAPDYRWFCDSLGVRKRCQKKNNTIDNHCCRLKAGNCVGISLIYEVWWWCIPGDNLVSIINQLISRLIDCIKRRQNAI